MSGLSAKDSAIRVTPEMEKQLETATPEMIKEIMRVAALEQGLATAEDPFHPEILTPTEKAYNNNEAHHLSRVLVINGESHELSGRDQNELNAAEIALHRRLQNEPEGQKRDAQGRFVAQQKAAAESTQNVELELKFRRGEISTDQYFAESGAIERHLESLGVSLDGLREAADRGVEHTWKSAAAEFLKQASPEYWPGGEQNRVRLQQKIEDLGLMDAEDKVAAIATAVNALHQQHALVPNPDTEYSKRLAQAKDSNEVAQISAAHFHTRGSSSLFDL